jgi:hypothetical protein
MPAVSEHKQDGSTIQDKDNGKKSSVRIVGAVAGIGSGAFIRIFFNYEGEPHTIG